MAVAKDALEAVEDHDAPSKGARTRSRIKARVSKLLQQQHYAKVTVADICEAVGITVGGFYFHFRSHEALIDELVEAFMDELAARFTPMLSEPVDQGLAAACLGAAQLYAEQSGVARAFQQLIRQDTAHAVRWTQAYDRLCAGLGTRLGDARGGAWDLEAHAVVVAILSELTKVYVHKDRAGGAASPEAVARGVNDLCRRILGSGGSPESPSVEILAPAPAALPEEVAKGRGAKTRTRIKAAFIHLLDARSHDAIGIVDICAEAGVTVGGFYFHFRKKEDLVAEAVSDYNERYWAVMDAALAVKTPAAAFGVASAVCVGSYSGSPGLVRCINELALTDRSYAELWSRWAAQWSARFSDRVSEEPPSAAGAQRSYEVLTFVDSLLFKLFVERDPGLVACAGNAEAFTGALARIWRRALSPFA
jgi:AcrR family transcriptional regulator